MADPSAVLVPRATTMDGFVAASSAADGITLRDLEPLTTLLVRTYNSLYRIVISRNTAVFVQGGQFFPEMTVARLDGSSFGGSFLKMGWIGVGLRMEIWAGGQRIVTSPVRAIDRESPTRAH
ncbi:MAG: hypothetical protein EXQ53_12095 [Acidobacteria bacterium]|nr:hypothetical protein [Acidobacteriota bacterium]